MWVQLKRWCVCRCYRGGIVVIDVFWRPLCVWFEEGRFICSELGEGATSDAGSISSELLMFNRVLNYGVCLCRGYDGCCVSCLYREAWSCRCSCIGRVSVLSMHRFYECVLCASCNSSECCVLHDLHFTNADPACKRRPYGKGIFESRSHNCFVCNHECLLLFTHPVALSAFIICSGLCVCTEMLWLCVLYVCFGSKVRSRTFGCVAMYSAVLFILRFRLLLYSAGSGVNRVQVVLSGFRVRLFCFVQANT